MNLVREFSIHVHNEQLAISASGFFPRFFCIDQKLLGSVSDHDLIYLSMEFVAN